MTRDNVERKQARTEDERIEDEDDEFIEEEEDGKHFCWNAIFSSKFQKWIILYDSYKKCI